MQQILADLKTPAILPPRLATRAGGKLAVGAWIEDRCYTRSRRHSSIGQVSPVAFEMRHSNQTAAASQAA